MLWIRCTVVAAVLFLVPAGCRPIVSLGRNPDGEALKKIEVLANYRHGRFYNLDTTLTYVPVAATGRRRPRWMGYLKHFFSKPKGTRPPRPLCYAVTDVKNSSFSGPTVIWFGHSSFLLKTKTANILADPSFSGFAGPFRGMVNAFAGSNEYSVRDMPSIDVLLISHDHYDHLDYTTVKKLKKKVKRVIVPVGVGAHFRRWGFPPAQITELYWHQSVTLPGGVTITATPAHHRSNRTFETNKTLWASFVVEADGRKLYYSGDTGYSSHFKQIGAQYGPFDLAMMECGQYNKKWPHSHMHPVQTAQAAVDIRATTIIPVHWGKFAESDHPWNEPVKLLLPAADSLGIQVSIPYIGQPYTVGQPPLRRPWYNW